MVGCHVSRVGEPACTVPADAPSSAAWPADDSKSIDRRSLPKDGGMPCGPAVDRSDVVVDVPAPLADLAEVAANAQGRFQRADCLTHDEVLSVWMVTAFAPCRAGSSGPPPGLLFAAPAGPRLFVWRLH